MPKRHAEFCFHRDAIPYMRASLQHSGTGSARHICNTVDNIETSIYSDPVNGKSHSSIYFALLETYNVYRSLVFFHVYGTREILAVFNWKFSMPGCHMSKKPQFCSRSSGCRRLGESGCVGEACGFWSMVVFWRSHDRFDGGTYYSLLSWIILSCLRFSNVTTQVFLP